jgi:hypothetical protein
MKALFVEKSANVKTGPIPVTYTQRESCPPSCPHYGLDCYAEAFHTRLAWNRAAAGLEWGKLCDKVAALPEGQLWRHNVAGDLPGNGETVDPVALGHLVAANTGRRGYTYTHKKSPQAVGWIRHANAWGFTINLSADDAGEADQLAELKAGPVVAIVPADTPEKTYTPAGRPIVICPAQSRDGVTCESCKLCAVPDRSVIIGFRAHGFREKITEARARRVIPIARA